MSILVDINGTIIRDNKVLRHVVDYLHAVEEDIYVISGSTVEKFRQYKDLMERLDISYKAILLNPIDQDTDHSFKTSEALKIPNLTLAIDNNPKILRLYTEMGIKTIHPDDLKKDSR